MLKMMPASFLNHSMPLHPANTSSYDMTTPHLRFRLRKLCFGFFILSPLTLGLFGAVSRTEGIRLCRGFLLVWPSLGQGLRQRSFRNWITVRVTLIDLANPYQSLLGLIVARNVSVLIALAHSAFRFEVWQRAKVASMARSDRDGQYRAGNIYIR